MQTAIEVLFRTFKIRLGNFTISPNYLQAILILFGVFMVIFSLARMRHLYVSWSFKGASAWVTLGFLIAIMLEGIMIVGGRTLFTEMVGWENAPKPILSALDTGRERLIEVLGVTDEVPISNASEKLTSEQILELYRSLEEEESDKAYDLICKIK